MTSFVVENLSGGQAYYFKVRAGNGCTPGDYSNELSATPIGFEEEGQATGFAENVLGEKTVKEEVRKISTPTVEPISTQTKPHFFFIATVLVLVATFGAIGLKVWKN